MTDNNSSDTAKSCKKPRGKPFAPGVDPRRNTKGTISNFAEGRKKAQEVLNRKKSEASDMTVLEAIFEDWGKSKDLDKQKALVEYGIGKVPNDNNITGSISVTTWADFIKGAGDADQK
jgi:hypothetical protein